MRRKKTYLALVILTILLPLLVYGIRFVTAEILGTSAHGETLDIKLTSITVGQFPNQQTLVGSPTDGPVTITVGLDDYLMIWTNTTTRTSDSFWDNINPFSENWPDIGQCVDWSVPTAFDGSPNRDWPRGSGHPVRYFLSSWDGVSDTKIFTYVECAFGDYSVGSNQERLYDEVTINVKGKGSPPPPPPGAPTVDITASPMSITQGQSTTVSWTSTNATSCIGSRGGSYSTSGSFVDTPSSTISYGMTCTGPGGSATDSVTVTVGAAPPPTPIGYHDGVDSGSCRTWGWAYDRSATSTSIAVHIYRDGPAGGGGTILNSFPTNVFRSDVNSTYSVSGNHGFDANLSSYIADGLNHPLYIYAIDTEGVSNPLLTNSPKTIQCVAPVGTQPSVDIKGQ